MKEDRRKYNKGVVGKAGRKPKAEEIQLIEKMDAIAAPDTVWKALLGRVLDGDTQAIKTWLAYRYGQPKQMVDITSQGESIAPPIAWVQPSNESQ